LKLTIRGDGQGLGFDREGGDVAGVLPADQNSVYAVELLADGRQTPAELAGLGPASSR